MADPSVKNLKPVEGGSFVPTNKVYFGVRDTDTKVDRSTIDALVTFSKTSYVADALPLALDTYLDVFNDALPPTRPDSAVDAYISDDIAYSGGGTYGPVLTLEKAVAGENNERGVLYVEADRPSSTDTPVGCEIVLGIQSYTQAASSYFTDSDFTGAVAGFISWPDNSGVFVFFVDDGVAKSIVVSGPVSEVGTRVSTETVVDWSADSSASSILHAPPAIRVVWDNSRRGKVSVYLTNNSTQTMSVNGGAETLDPNEELELFESTISALGQFQAAARMGNYDAENRPNKVVAFAGISRGEVSDFVEVHSIRVEEFGVTLVDSGLATPSSSLSISTSDSQVINTLSDIDSWDTSEIDDLVTSTSTSFSITQSAADTNAAMYYEEPDLSSRKFLVLIQGSILSPSHEGSYSTGIGVDIDDGTNLTALRFLDRVEDYKLGIFSGVDLKNGSGNDFSSFSSEWPTKSPEILIIADASQDFCEVFVSEDTTPVSSKTESAFSASVSYSTINTTYSLPTIAAGFVDGGDGVNYGGIFTVDKLIVIPGIDVFLPNKAKEYVDKYGGTALPDGTGNWTAWTKTQSGTPTITAVSDGHWSIAATSSSDHAFYTFSLDATIYSPGESGITVLAKMRIDSWIDRFGGTSTNSIPTCALIGIDLGSNLFLQLQYIKSSNETFLFMSQDSTDYLDVLSQTSAGQAISTQIDMSEFHTLMICVKPQDSITLYIDMAGTPAINIPWTDVSAVQKASTYLTAGQSVSIGAIPVSSTPETASLTLGMLGVSAGSGFNYECAMSVSDSVLQNNVYGTEANIFVDVTDEDP